MSDPRTIALYDARAGDYAQAFEKAAPSADLRGFMDALPAGARVLDLGCGTGRAAAFMAAEGFDVDPVDGSAGMVAEARTRHGLPARQMRFDELEGAAIYDAVWANFSLTHAPHEALPGHLAAIARALRPGGLFHIALKTGSGTLRDDLGRFYALHAPEALIDQLAEAGFTLRKRRDGTDKGFAGTTDAFTSLLLTRNG